MGILRSFWVVLLPLIFFWGYSYLGHRVGFSFGMDEWWGFPFFITGIILSVVMVLLTIYITIKEELTK